MKKFKLKCCKCGHGTDEHEEWCSKGWKQNNFLWLRDCYWRLKSRYDTLLRKQRNLHKI